MKNYEKTFVMFYRGKDDSNKVSSATKIALDNERLSKYIQFEFINLDKRNFEKFFDKLEQLPSVVYAWHDEEILIDYIKEKHPEVEIRIYDMKSSSEHKDNFYGRKTKYIIAQKVIEEYKASQGTSQWWVVERDVPKEVTINNYDYENMLSWNKEKYFESESEANASIKKRLEDDLKESEDMIKYYEKKIKDIKKKLKKFA